LYNVKDLKQITGSDPLVIIGACGGPYPFFGADSEASTYLCPDIQTDSSRTLISLLSFIALTTYYLFKFK